MTVERQIREIKAMSREIQTMVFGEHLCDAIAAGLFDAGYRRQADVIDDFVKRLEQKAVMMGCWVENHEGDYDAVAIHDVYEIAQEMKGAEE